MFPVCIRCFTFNHADYIEETMNGFCMQQTVFPFVCVVIDDASTDGEPELIRNYVYKNFDLKDISVFRNENNDNYELIFARHKTNMNCFFAVCLLKYNHYSIKKPKQPYISEWTDYAKYHVSCEGDDYWTDQQKLQMQYDYMESHPECTMTCHRVKLYSEKRKKYIGEQYCRNSDGELNPVDIINRTGIYIPTCSIMFRPEIRNNYPDYCRNCYVRDYPLQITAAMKGSVYYFNRIMGVYRIENSNSWAGKQKFNSVDSSRIHIVRSQMEMFKGFSKDYPQYEKVFQKKIMEHICRNIPNWRCKKENVNKYLELFSNEINMFSFKGKLLLWIGRLRIPLLVFFFRKVIFKNYFHKRKYYDGYFKRKKYNLILKYESINTK